METRYVGKRSNQGCEVTKEVPGETVVSALDPRLDLWNHSPSGLEWGYAGSGPAQLALALLADAVGDDLAVPLHQQFKWRFVSRFPKEGFEMTASEIQSWAEEEAKKLDLSGWEEED